MSEVKSENLIKIHREPRKVLTCTFLLLQDTQPSSTPVNPLAPSVTTDFEGLDYLSVQRLLAFLIILFLV